MKDLEIYSALGPFDRWLFPLNFIHWHQDPEFLEMLRIIQTPSSSHSQNAEPMMVV